MSMLRALSASAKRRYGLDGIGDQGNNGVVITADGTGVHLANTASSQNDKKVRLKETLRMARQFC